MVNLRYVVSFSRQSIQQYTPISELTMSPELIPYLGFHHILMILLAVVIVLNCELLI